MKLLKLILFNLLVLVLIRLVLFALEELLDLHMLNHIFEAAIPVVITICSIIYAEFNRTAFSYFLVATLLSITCSYWLDIISINNNLEIAWAGIYWGLGILASSFSMLLYRIASINNFTLTLNTTMPYIIEIAIIACIPILYWYLLG